jgi:uncharacterized SAM-binding protein YcdF (DUF218 family)
MISRLFDPAFLGLMILLIGLVGWTRSRPRRSMLRWKTLAWLGFVFLWLSASPWFSNTFVRWLQPPPADLAPALAGTDPSERAMVVLAGGSRNEYDFIPPVERLDESTQGRLLGGARIYRDQGGFGLVVVTGTGHPYVESMADYLVLLGIPRDKIALEIKATDTETNAIYSAEILKKYGAKKVVLVTSALHMPRSVVEFEAAGVQVIPAPVDYIGGQGWRLLPSSATMHRTSRTLHEILGRLEP